METYKVTVKVMWQLTMELQREVQEMENLKKTQVDRSRDRNFKQGYLAVGVSYACKMPRADSDPQSLLIIKLSPLGRLIFLAYGSH